VIRKVLASRTIWSKMYWKTIWNIW